MPYLLKAVVLLLAFTPIIGCGPTYWRNNNPSAKWNTDLYECTQAHSVTITSGGGAGLVGAINTASVRDRLTCTCGAIIWRHQDD